MTKKVKVELEFVEDTPSSMTFDEVYDGLDDIWYKFSCDPDGSIEVWGNPAGLEFLGRYFLKLAKTPKVSGYHAHHSLEHSDGFVTSGPELTIGVVDHRPPAV